MRRNPNPERPRNVTVALEAYLNWNMHAYGQVETSNRSSVYWYRDDVFYRGWKPVIRAMQTAGGGTVLFKLYDESCGWYKLGERFAKERLFHVEDIGVAGVGAGLTMGKEAYLQQLRQQWLSKAGFLVDQARSVAFNACWQWVDSKREDFQVELNRHGYPIPYRDWRIDTRMAQIVSLGEDTGRLSDLFDLDWPDFPSGVLNGEFEQIIRAKAMRFMENAPRRERAKARKDAKQAFALAIEEKAA